MIKKTILITLLSSLLFAENNEQLLQEIKTFKPEYDEKSYIKELEKTLIHKKNLIEIDNIPMLIEKKEEKLKKLKSLEKASKSSLLDSLILNRYIHIIDLKKPKEVEKYLVNISDKLYKNSLCDGYLFKGEYEVSLNNNLEKALNIYNEGLLKCKVDWKRFLILGRFNQLDYKLNKHKYK